MAFDYKVYYLFIVNICVLVFSVDNFFIEKSLYCVCI